MSHDVDYKYLKLINNILDNGEYASNRTGTDTIRIFGAKMRFDISDGKLPLLSGKKVYTRAIIHELLWMLSGETNIRYLLDNDVHIWDQWVDPKTAIYDEDGNLTDGDLPNIYQAQWRHWKDVDDVGSTRYIDQIENIVDTLKNNPTCRRIILSAWNVGVIDRMALPPCHYSCQFFSKELTDKETNERYGLDLEQAKLDGVPTRKLSGMVNMRSSDVALGLPFNIVQYTLLVNIIALETNHLVDELIWVGCDVHLYDNQLDGVERYSNQVLWLTTKITAPKLVIKRKAGNVDKYTHDDFDIIDYDPLPAIKFPKAAK